MSRWRLLNHHKPSTSYFCSENKDGCGDSGATQKMAKITGSICTADSDPTHQPVFSMAPQRRYLKRGPEHLSSWWGVKVVIQKVGCANEHSDQQRNFLPSMLGAEMLAILLGCNCWYIQMPRWKNLRRLGPRLATIGPALGPGDVHYVFFQVQKIRWD